MIEAIGLMVAVYGVARLFQTSSDDKHPWGTVIGIIAIVALVGLAFLLHDQASRLSDAVAGIGQ